MPMKKMGMARQAPGLPHLVPRDWALDTRQVNCRQRPQVLAEPRDADSLALFECFGDGRDNGVECGGGIDPGQS